MDEQWTPPDWTVGERIAKLRRAKGWDQAQLAQATGLSVAAISTAERGKHPPRLSTLNLLSQALGAPVEWIRDGAVS